MYGLVVFVSALAAIGFSLRVDHGVIVASSAETSQEIARAALLMAAGAATLFAVVAAIVSIWFPLPGGGSGLIVWCLLCPLAGFGVAGLRTLTLWNNRIRNFPLVTRSRIQRSLWTVVATIAAGMWQYGLVFGMIVGNMAGIYLLGKGLPAGRWPRPRDIVRTVRENRKFVTFSLPADVVNTTAARMPMVLFPAFFGLTEAGYLSLSYLVVAAPARFVGTAIGEVFYSHAAREYQRDGSCIRSVVRIGKLLAAISVAGFGLLFIISDLLFVHAFGEQWLPASTFTRVLIPMLAVNFIVSPLSVVLYVSSRQKEDFYWQIAFLIATTSACAGSYWLGQPAVVSLICLSVAGTVMYLIYLAMIVRFAFGAAGGSASSQESSIEWR